MSEISREIAIHCMKVCAEIEVCEECKIYGETGTDHCYEDACRKAISDMEKLEKIEQIIDANRTNPLADCGNLLNEIEQIVKGE